MNSVACAVLVNCIDFYNISIYNYSMSIRTGLGRNLSFISINTAASAGNYGLIPAPSGADINKKIKVVSYCLTANNNVSVQWKSGNTPLSGSMRLSNSGSSSICIASEPSSHLLETAINATLVLNVGGNFSIGGHLSYYLEQSVAYS